MKIAVTYDDGQIFAHFGYCEKFKIYEIRDGEIVSSEVIDAVAGGYESLVLFLKNEDVSTLICDRLEVGERMALMNEDIDFHQGISGEADMQVAGLLAGALAFHPDVMCLHDIKTPEV